MRYLAASEALQRVDLALERRGLRHAELGGGSGVQQLSEVQGCRALKSVTDFTLSIAKEGKDRGVAPNRPTVSATPHGAM